MMSTNTIKELALEMFNWERSNGEDLLDGRFASYVDEDEFMEWCLANGKITEDQHALYVDAVENGTGETEFTILVFNDLGMYEEEPYAVVTFMESDSLDFEENNAERDVAYLVALENFAGYVLSLSDGLDRWAEFKSDYGV